MTRSEAIEMLVNATYSEEWQGNEKLTTAHLMAYEALSDRRGRSDAKEIVIAYIKSKGREDLMDVVKQTERSEE